MSDIPVFGRGPTEVPVPAADGGTGTTGITGILKGNGISDVTAAVAGTDYLTPTGNGSGLTSMVNSQISGSAASGANSDITTLSGLTKLPATPSAYTSYYTRVCDFTSTGPLQEVWATAAMASGTLAGTGASNANHIGTVLISSSTNANSGWRFSTGTLDFLLSGYEESNFVFKTPAVINSASVIRMGFLDSVTSVEPVDGVYIQLANTTLRGDCISNSVETLTPTTYTVSAATWYRARVALNSNATSATFTLYSESGAVLWTEVVTTNIPNTAGRETGHVFVAYNTDTTAVQVLILDYMDLSVLRTLTR